MEIILLHAFVKVDYFLDSYKISEYCKNNSILTSFSTFTQSNLLGYRKGDRLWHGGRRGIRKGFHKPRRAPRIHTKQWLKGVKILLAQSRGIASKQMLLGVINTQTVFAIEMTATHLCCWQMWSHKEGEGNFVKIKCLNFSKILRVN